MNEQQSLHDSQYKLFVGAFSNYDGENTKKSVSLPDNEVQTFLEGEENQYTKRKTESCVFSGFGVSISLGWERKSTTGRFATGRFWSFTSLTRELSSYTLEEKFHIYARPCIILPQWEKCWESHWGLFLGPHWKTPQRVGFLRYILLLLLLFFYLLLLFFWWSLFELSVLLGYYS